MRNKIKIIDKVKDELKFLSFCFFKNKVGKVGTVLWLAFALIYGMNPSMLTKIISFLCITIGAEFIPFYYKNKQIMYECFFKNYNKKYYDMYVGYFTMNIKLAVLSFGVLFSCSYEIFSKILQYRDNIQNILVHFLFSSILSGLAVIYVLAKFNNCKFNKTFCEIEKNRKTDFISDFTEEEIKIISNVIDK